MSEFWNEAELKRPTILTMEVANASFIIKLQRTLTKLIQNDHKQSEKFSETAALLSRLIARRKNSFRRMIGFRALLKLNSAVARLLRVDLQRDLESFYGLLPDMVFGKKDIASLPTQNYLDFILARLLAVYNIHQRIHECNLAAAEYFTELMRANNFMDLNVLLIAVLAKLRSLNILFGNRCVNTYNVLRTKRDLFPLGKQKKTTATELELPKHLEEFLTSAPILGTESLADEVKSAKPNVLVLNKQLAQKTADIGKAVERQQPKVKVPKQTEAFNMDQLNNLGDIKSFIAAENKARKLNIEHCTTKNIENHLWIGAQKIFERKIQSGDEKKALNVFRKFLSSNF